MRFVVVEIPDNEEADAFVEAIKTGYVMFSKPHPKLPNEVSLGKPETEWKVPQVYAVPTMFCECPDYNGVSVKSSKYGWYVHVKCAKPRPTALQHPFNLVEMAANGNQWVDGRDRRYYMGFRANRKPWRHEDEAK